MARRSKNGHDDDGKANTTAGHNSAARAETIRDVCRELAALDTQSTEINAARSKLLQTRVKGDLGMSIANFKAAYRLHGLEDDARDEYIDAIRETFAALGVGEQSDWLAQGFPKTAPGPAAPDDPAGATVAFGRQAGLVGRPATDNPHKPGSKQAIAWSHGWAEGQASIAAEMGAPKAGTARRRRRKAEDTHAAA